MFPQQIKPRWNLDMRHKYSYVCDLPSAYATSYNSVLYMYPTEVGAGVGQVNNIVP